MELKGAIEPTIGPYEVYEDEWLNAKAAFAELAGSSRLLLVVDDAHWADEPSLLALRHLLAAPTAHSVAAAPTAALQVFLAREDDHLYEVEHFGPQTRRVQTRS